MTTTEIRKGSRVTHKADADRTDRFCPIGTVTSIHGDTANVRWDKKTGYVGIKLNDLVTR